MHYAHKMAMSERQFGPIEILICSSIVEILYAFYYTSMQGHSVRV